jgi:hypothetical protein
MFRWTITDSTTDAYLGTIDTADDDEAEARAAFARSLGHPSEAERMAKGGTDVTLTRAGSASVAAQFDGKPFESFDPAAWAPAAPTIRWGIFDGDEELAQIVAPDGEAALNEHARRLGYADEAERQTKEPRDLDVMKVGPTSFDDLLAPGPAASDFSAREN